MAIPTTEEIERSFRPYQEGFETGYKGEFAENPYYPNDLKAWVWKRGILDGRNLRVEQAVEDQMDNRLFKVTYGLPPCDEKVVEGEYWIVEEDECLRIFNASKECTIMFASSAWVFIEDITHRAHKERDLRKAFAG